MDLDHVSCIFLLWPPEFKRIYRLIVNRAEFEELFTAEEIGMKKSMLKLLL
jgi:hypothetical protein